MAKRWGVDVDGVVANFRTAGAAEASNMVGREIPDLYGVWDFFKAAMTPEEVDALWHRLQTDPSWWEGLKPMPRAKSAIAWLNMLAERGHDIFWITHRPGHGMTRATTKWLCTQGATFPSVIAVEGSKRAIVEALKLDVFVDDKPSNCEDAAAASNHPNVYMVDRHWNRTYVPKVGSNIQRVDDLDTVLAFEGRVPQ